MEILPVVIGFAVGWLAGSQYMYTRLRPLISYIAALEAAMLKGKVKEIKK